MKNGFIALMLLGAWSINIMATTTEDYVNPTQATTIPPPPTATTSDIASWAAAIQNRNVTTPPPPSQPETFSGFSTGQNPFQPTGQETQPYFDPTAPLPYTPTSQGATPPNVSNEALNMFFGGGTPAIPMTLPTGNTAWFNPNDPHPEVAFAKAYFDTAGWGYEDWVRNSMRYWDKNDKDYYFRPGQPYGNPAQGRPGGYPQGSGMNTGGFGRGIGGGQPSFGGAMSGGATGLPPASPMVTAAAPTPNVSPQVSVSNDLTQLEIPDELWAFIPEQLRGQFGNSVMSWLRSMGFSGRGNIGRYGERSYQRPSGQQGEIWFTPEMFNAFSDPEVSKWAKWLLGERGFTARSSMPEGATPTPPQG